MSDVPLVSPGDVLDGKYVVERRLGQGGMGVVVAARHLVLKTNVAIKLLLPDVTRNEENVKRFHREARSAVRIKSPHAARVHDVGRLADGTPYMVMDLLTGTDLEALVRKRGSLSPSEAVGFVLQALDAVGEAHALGIIHRDLKPANLFLADQPERLPIVKVLDFGIARDFDEGKDQRLTASGDVMGSPAYMSPEQMIEARTADARSDIWSLGACLYELVTGALPFNGKTLAELCKNVQRAPPSAPDSLRPDLPPALSKIILRCLEKDPAQRFGSAAELAQALSACVSSPSVPARLTKTQPLEPTPAVPLAPKRSAKPAMIAGLALAMLVATGIAIFVARAPSVAPVAPAVPAPAGSEARVTASTAPPASVPEMPPPPDPTGAPESIAVSNAEPRGSATSSAPAVRPARLTPRPTATMARPPATTRSAPTDDPKVHF